MALDQGIQQIPLEQIAPYLGNVLDSPNGNDYLAKTLYNRLEWEKG